MQRYFAKEKTNNNFILNNDDLYHIKTVMRMKDNDKMEVIYNNELYVCIIKNNTIIIESKEKTINKRILETTLIIPLLKEHKFNLILQKATELGVSKIIPINTERSIIKIDKSKMDKKLERWTKICKEASEQSKRLSIPIITNIKQIKELNNIDGTKIVCSTKEKTTNIKFFLQKSPKCDKISVVIGPEGGLTTKEENDFINLGFNPITLGNNIMRVETVPIFILSVLNYENME